MATRAVMILVVEAMRIRASAFCSYKTRPLSTSTRMADVAEVLIAKA
jgi:hypothetical protein